MSEKLTVVRNRRAFHNYEILERFEAGIVLVGSEVKSLRSGQASIAEAYANFRNGELYVVQLHIPEYTHQGYTPHEPLRARKLLLHRRELKALEEATTRRGLTLVPIELYFKDGRAKLEVGLARGRKAHDKRDKLKEQAARREVRAEQSRRR